MKIDISHSQYGEDVIAAAQFPDGFVGDVLEIGAWMPETFSNSLAFVEQDWKAVVIEPSPNAVKALVKHHRGNQNVKVVQAAVVVPGGQPLVEMDLSDDAVSSSDPTHVQLWGETCSYYGRAQVATLALEQISIRFGHFDVISIDTEGSSEDLFMAAMDLGWRPRVWIVEYLTGLQRILERATREPYMAVACNSTNVVLSL